MKEKTIQTQIFFLPKIFSDPIFLGQKCFWNQIFLDPKFWTHNIFGPQNCLDPKISMPPNFWTPRYFTRNFWDTKSFWTYKEVWFIKMLGKIWTLIFFLSQNFWGWQISLDPKSFCTEIFLDEIIIWRFLSSAYVVSPGPTSRNSFFLFFCFSFCCHNPNSTPTST